MATDSTSLPRGHRSLHWALALPMLLILLTIALRNGWMEKHFMAGLLDQGLQTVDVVLDDKALIKLAKSIRNAMFAWHKYAGYVISAVILLRLAYSGRFGWQWALPWQAGLERKARFKGWVYVIFYASVVVSCCTGLYFDFVAHPSAKVMKEVHQWFFWLYVAFPILHLAGMIVAEHTDEPGLVSRMFGARLKK